MKLRVLGLLAFTLIGFSGYAVATPTLVGTTTDPTGINGLIVDGTTYNVTFSTTTYLSPFTQGSEASVAAAGAMAAALSSLEVTQLAGVSPAPQCPPNANDCQYNSLLFVAVDNAIGPNDVASCFPMYPPSACSQHYWTGGYTYDTSGNTFGQLGGLGPLGVWGYGYAADFTAVPEPGRVSLFGLGLAAIGFMRRRKN